TAKGGDGASGLSERPYSSWAAQAQLMVIGRGHLFGTSARPDAGNPHFAFGTAAIRGDSVRLNRVTPAFDQVLVATGAAGIFPGADAARQVARIDEAETLFGADFGGTHQGFGCGCRWFDHLVVGVEGSHVPGNVWADRSQEAGGVAQLFGAVVEARYHQRHDFEPDAVGVDHADCVGDALERAAQGAIVAIVE